MDNKTYRTGIDATYRRSALRIISAFRTVSTDATVVIAWMMPMKLIVDVEGIKQDTRKETNLLNCVQIVDDAMAHNEHRRKEETTKGETSTRYSC